MRSHKTHIPLLREELIEEEILPRLPVKSLLRLRYVSKSWRSLIDSKRFIKTHLRNSTRNTSFPHHRLLVQNSKAKTMAQCSLLSLFNKPEIHALELNFPTNITIDSITCVGCCNGLVCILLNIKLDTAQFILWNPSTRISKKLPDMEKNMLGFTFRCFGFGSDESSDDYKVVAITRDGKQTMCSNIYSLKNDSWKKINDCKFFPIYPDLGILARGKLHWECRGETEESSWKIIAFDLKRDAFEVVEKPSDLERCPKPCLGMMGECLLVYCWHKPCIDIWVMKEYGVKESWEKVMVVDPSPTWASPSIAAFCIDARVDEVMALHDL